ncbi:hypothetical protein ACFSCZ_15895 [Siminovitchia sediminis]|uniref:Uncharacterized protein n=1 Tax=Siminovitchia sediminis TaxID=1274353 RepID=A0ABW4KJL1_9BACI
MLGLTLLIFSLILVIVLAFLGVKYTHKHAQADPKKKFKAAKYLLILGSILGGGYLLFAKNFSSNIDIVISWILLASGCFFAAGLAFFTGYHQENFNQRK